MAATVRDRHTKREPDTRAGVLFVVCVQCTLMRSCVPRLYIVRLIELEPNGYQVVIRLR